MAITTQRPTTTRKTTAVLDRRPRTLLQKADEVLPSIMKGAISSRALLRAVGAWHHAELAAEHETERFIDDCRRNLQAPAWLPLAVQKRLFETLVNERAAHNKTREELGAEVVRVRRALRVEIEARRHQEDVIAALTRRAEKATKGRVASGRPVTTSKKKVER